MEMKTCRDCLHYKVCENYDDSFCYADIVIKPNHSITEYCGGFTDYYNWEYLPCRVNDTVYHINLQNIVEPVTIVEVVLGECGIQDLYVENDDGICFKDSFDTFYMTYEEAEKATKK